MSKILVTGLIAARWELTQLSIEKKIQSSYGKKVVVGDDAVVYINYGKPNEKQVGKIKFNSKKNTWRFTKVNFS